MKYNQFFWLQPTPNLPTRNIILLLRPLGSAQFDVPKPEPRPLLSTTPCHMNYSSSFLKFDQSIRMAMTRLTTCLNKVNLEHLTTVVQVCILCSPPLCRFQNESSNVHLYFRFVGLPELRTDVRKTSKPYNNSSCMVLGSGFG